PTVLTASLRAIVQEGDKDLPLYRIRPITSLVASSIARQRFSLTLLATFALLALALAGPGRYTVMNFFVTQRTQEIGIRRALGAQRNDVLKLVVGQGMKLTLTGVVLGVLAAITLTRLMKSLLLGVSATDPLTFTTIALLLGGVAL